MSQCLHALQSQCTGIIRTVNIPRGFLDSGLVHKAKRKGDRVVGIVDRIPRKVEKSLWYFDSGEVFHLRIRSTDTKT